MVDGQGVPDGVDCAVSRLRCRHNDRMVMVPAIVWRGGPVRRAVTVGACAGLFFGGLAWLDSGMLISGAIVFVVLGVSCGFWMGRRLIRYWPRADELSGAQRAAVVAAARRGDRIGDHSLAPAIVDYSRALHAAADTDTPLRRAVVGFVLVVAAAMALWDAALGSPGNAVASAVYLVIAGLELFWWPNRRERLLSNADRATATARQADIPD
jgi:hypothetical protein